MWRPRATLLPIPTALTIVGIFAIALWACGTGTAGPLAPTAASLPTTTGPTVQPAAAEPTAAQVLAAATPTTEQPPAPAAGTAQQAQAGTTHLPLLRGGSGQGNQGGWHQLAGGPQRTGYVPVQLQAPLQFRWVWNGPAGGGDAGPAPDHLALPKGVQPVIGDGRVYVGHSDGIVRALNAGNGTLAWSSRIGGQMLGTVAYHPVLNRIFAGSTNGRIFSLNAATGEIVNSFDAGGPIEMSPLLVGDVVYIGTIIGKGQNNGESTRGTLYALNAANLSERWRYDPGAGLIASPAYATREGGLVLIQAEDKSVHAVRATDGTRRWRQVVNAGRDPQREWAAFPDTYPAVSEANNVVIIRSYFLWQRTWTPNPSQTDTLEEIRAFLQNNPEYQSFFVLDLDTGIPRYVAPVLGGGIGNNDDYYSTPPQAVVRPIDGGEVAYLSWRSSQTCPSEYCDAREEGAIGEMDLGNGDIRFINIYKNAWQWRMPADELGSLTMAGDTLFYSHWMTMAAVRITDRSPGRGLTYSNPIQTEKVVGIVNSLGVGNCDRRDSARRFCPDNHYGYDSGNVFDPGYYIYYVNDKIYDRFFTPPVFGVAIDATGAIYWKSVDGAIISLSPASLRASAGP